MIQKIYTQTYTVFFILYFPQCDWKFWETGACCTRRNDMLFFGPWPPRIPCMRSTPPSLQALG